MKFAFIFVLIAAIGIGIFLFMQPNDKQISIFEDADNNAIINNEVSEEVMDSIWRTTELTDIRTGEKFTINQFDKPILLESFAVWCPTCTKQQNKIKELHEEIGDNAISISLNTDPNEDEELILNHITENEFDWYYAISPKEVTEDLIKEFGVTVANAPSAPVILINQQKEATLLRTGVKSANELKRELKL